MKNFFDKINIKDKLDSIQNNINNYKDKLGSFQDISIKSIFKNDDRELNENKSENDNRVNKSVMFKSNEKSLSSKNLNAFDSKSDLKSNHSYNNVNEIKSELGENILELEYEKENDLNLLKENVIEEKLELNIDEKENEEDEKNNDISIICPDCLSIPNIKIVSDLNISIECNYCNYSNLLNIECYIKLLSNLKQNKLKCNNILEHYGKDAVQWCKDCKRYLCELCYKEHLLWVKNVHKLIKLNNCETFCQYHSNYNNEYYCLNCKHHLCIKCDLSLHLDHKVIKIKKYMELINKKELINKLNDLQNYLDINCLQIKNSLCYKNKGKKDLLINEIDSNYAKFIFRNNQYIKILLLIVNSYQSGIINYYQTNNVISNLNFNFDKFNKDDDQYLLNKKYTDLINEKEKLFPQIEQENDNIISTSNKDNYNENLIKQDNEDQLNPKLITDELDIRIDFTKKNEEEEEIKQINLDDLDIKIDFTKKNEESNNNNNFKEDDLNNNNNNNQNKSKFENEKNNKIKKTVDTLIEPETAQNSEDSSKKIEKKINTNKINEFSQKKLIDVDNSIKDLNSSKTQNDDDLKIEILPEKPNKKDNLNLEGLNNYFKSTKFNIAEIKTDNCLLSFEEFKKFNFSNISKSSLLYTTEYNCKMFYFRDFIYAYSMNNISIFDSKEYFLLKIIPNTMNYRTLGFLDNGIICAGLKTGDINLYKLDKKMELKIVTTFEEFNNNEIKNIFPLKSNKFAVSSKNKIKIFSGEINNYKFLIESKEKENVTNMLELSNEKYICYTKEGKKKVYFKHMKNFNEFGYFIDINTTNAISLFEGYNHLFVGGWENISIISLKDYKCEKELTIDFAQITCFAKIRMNNIILGDTRGNIYTMKENYNHINVCKYFENSYNEICSIINITDDTIAISSWESIKIFKC